ncbi:porin [Lentibacter algarum]|uniref:porin n=1 Tax=Lentibacter algarum TaxID=576131 RepID=UPI00339D717C
MKKILFATTALVATASVAAADVTFTGMGRFGVKSVSTDAVAAVAGKMTTTAQSTAAAAVGADGTITAGAVTAAVVGTTAATDAEKLSAVNAVAAARVALQNNTTATAVAIADLEADLADAEANLAAISDTAAVAKKTTTDITSRMQIDVKASVELDSGITLGAATRFRSTDGAAGVGFNAPTFTMSTGGLTLVVGNNYGQMYHGNMSVNNVGLTGLGFEADVFTGFDEYSSNGTGPQGADVNYSMGNLSMGVSHAKGSGSTQASVSYSADALSFGASMQDGKAKADDFSSVGVGYAFAGGSVNLAYGDNNGTKTTVLGGTYSVAAATSVTAFVKDTNTAGVKNVYGVGVSHDLGGASLKAGYVDNAAGSVADFGIVFNF